MYTLLKYLLVAIIFSEAHCGERHKISFDRGYFTLYWEVNDGQIEVEIVGWTNGYVGFGLNNKKKMDQAELIIAGVQDSTLKPYFRTYLGKGHHVKEVPNNVWVLNHAEQNATHTVIRAERMLEPNEEEMEVDETCPIERPCERMSRSVSRPKKKKSGHGDRFPPVVPIKDSKLWVLWACGLTDIIKKHKGNGSRHINLIHPDANALSGLEEGWVEFEFNAMRTVQNNELGKIMYPHLFK